MEPKVSSFKNTVLFSKAASLPDVYPKVIQAFPEAFPDSEIITDSSLDHFKKQIEEKKKSVLLFHLTNADELQAILAFLPTIQNEIKEKSVFVAILAKVTSSKVDAALLKMGCIEILRYDIPQKSLFHKIRRYASNLAEYGSGSINNEVTAFKVRGFKTENSELISKDPGIALISALETTFDFWLVRKALHIHRYQGMWLIEMIGPSPSAAKWKITEEFKKILPGEEQVWEWVKRDHLESFGEVFNTNPAKWVFTGRKPEYSWVNNRWAFVSETPALHLIQNGKVTQTRFFENEDGILELSKNSDIAKGWFKQIKDTFDRDHYIQIEKEEFGENAIIEYEKTPNLPWNDKLDSKEIDPATWNVHDLFGEEGPEWKKSSVNESKKEIEEHLKEEIETNLDIPLGSDAMKDCGINASVAGLDIELMSYSENQPIILIGSSLKLNPKDKVEIDIASENLGPEMNFKLIGTVLKIESDDSERRIVVVLLDQDTRLNVGKIRDAIQKRQLEIFEFFKRAKGRG